MYLNLKRTLLTSLKALGSRRAISLVICFQMGFEPLLSHASPNQPPSESTSVDTLWDLPADPQTADAFQLHFSTQDPALDQDPYFMRSQAWVPRTTNDVAMAFRKSAAGLEISIPGAAQNLNLRLPLTPIQATEDFIFFSLDEGSDLFARAAGPGATPGEGIFFLSRASLAQQSRNGTPAPVFFFPLSGQGWSGTLRSLELPQMESIVIANKTDSVAIELHDVEELMKAEQINLMIASSLSARNRGRVTKELYPAPGMTAAFGTTFTGLDLQYPAKSLWAPAVQTSQSIFEKTFFQPLFQPLLQKVARWWPLGEQASQALPLPPALVNQIIFVATVQVTLLAASVVIKYAHPGIRRKLKSLRADEKPTTNPLRIAGREFKEVFDVYTAAATTYSQVAIVNFSNGLEMFLDRFAPTIAAADHTLIKRNLNKYFFFQRDTIKKVPVNSRLWVQNALGLGGVDTAMVGVQYEIAVPFLADAISPHTSEAMQARIERTFDPHNPKTKELAQNDTIRTGIAYWSGGAAAGAAEARGQLVGPATRDVLADMRTRGLDPEDPKNASLRESEILKRLNVLLKQRGLPDDSHFLFDAGTLFYSVPKALGYTSPEGAAAKQSYILEKRAGLRPNALRKALVTANMYAKNAPSPMAKEVVAALTETAENIKFIEGGKSTVLENIERGRKLRQQLTLLSYEGNVEYAVQNLPEVWSQKYSPQAAQIAGLFFRQALYSYLSQEGDNLLIPDAKLMEKYGAEAKAKALQAVRADHPEFKGGALSANLQFELKVRTNLEINALVRAAIAEEKAEAYAPKKPDWIARRKEARALAETETRLQAFLGTAAGQNVNDEQLVAIKQKFYAEAIARKVGLHIEDPEVAAAQNREDYVAMINWVEKKAQDRVELEIKNDPNLSRYLQKLSGPEQLQFKMSLYANNYLLAYREATGPEEKVKAIDPAQPGRFQWLRQTEVVRNSAFLTRTLRTFESFGDDQSIELGLQGVIFRNVPLAQDLFSTHRRLLRTILPSLLVTFAWNTHVQHVHLLFQNWLLFQTLSAATISTPSQWLNRVYKLNGIKPDGGFLTKVGYALPYSWVTFLGMFPIMLYSDDVGKLFNTYLASPVTNAMAQVGLKEWLASAAIAATVTAAAKFKIKSDFEKRAENLGPREEPRQDRPRTLKLSCEAFLAQ
jgi:hypothetical protein